MSVERLDKLESWAEAVRAANDELGAAQDDLERATQRKADAEKAADEAWRSLRWHILGYDTVVWK